MCLLKEMLAVAETNWVGIRRRFGRYDSILRRVPMNVCTAHPRLQFCAIKHQGNNAISQRSCAAPFIRGTVTFDDGSPKRAVITLDEWEFSSLRGRCSVAYTGVGRLDDVGVSLLGKQHVSTARKFTSDEGT